MRLYFAFIYFKKAFDRRLLCLNFSKVAIEGKSLEVIKAFYRHVKFCIGVEGFLSEYFFDNLGLMQGEMLSPIPFNLYVNDFENSFLNACWFFLRVILLNSIYIRFQEADDMVLFSEHVEGLQCLLNELYSSCNTWKMQVNVESKKM